jgi:hypothetical protein
VRHFNTLPKTGDEILKFGSIALRGSAIGL